MAQLAADLNTGKRSSVEIAQDYLARIQQSDHNAFISIDHESVLAQAKEADQKRADGNTSALLGVPIA